MPYLDLAGLNHLVEKIKTLFDKKADLNSPILTGTPKAPTPTASTNSTQIATTAFVKAQGYASGNHTHSAATTGTAGFMSSADKTKLNGIAVNANNYTHPSTHPASMIQMSDGKTLQALFEQAIPITDWNDAIRPGFYYSAANAANAPTFTGNTNLYGLVFCYSKQVRQVVMPQFGNNCKVRFCHSYDSSTWYGWQQLLPNATTSENGLMTAADKTKLSGIAANANNYTHPSSHPATMITQDSTHRFVTDAEKSKWNSVGGSTAITYIYENPDLSSLGSDILMKITAASNPNNAKSVKIVVTGNVSLGTLSANKAYMDFGSSLDIPVHIDWSNAVFPQMNTKKENITLIRHTGVNTVYHEGLTIRATENESLMNGTTCIENAGEGDIIIHNCDLTGVDTIGALVGGSTIRHTGAGKTFIENCRLQYYQWSQNIKIDHPSAQVFIHNSILKQLVELTGKGIDIYNAEKVYLSNCLVEGGITARNCDISVCNSSIYHGTSISETATANIDGSWLYNYNENTSYNGVMAAINVSGKAHLINSTFIGQSAYSSSNSSNGGCGVYLDNSYAKLTASNCTFRGYKHSSNTAGFGLGIGASSKISAMTCMVLHGCRFDRVSISSRTQTGDIKVGTSSICPRYNILGCSFYGSTIFLGGSNISSSTATNKYMPISANFFSQTS